jgi:hypothetical protein
MGCNCKGSKKPVINDEIGRKVVLKIINEGNVLTEEEKRTLYLYYDFLYGTNTNPNCIDCYENYKLKLIEKYKQTL